MNKKDKRNTIIFYVMTFLFGIFLCVITFFFVFSTFSHDTKVNVSPTTELTNNLSNKFIAVIKNIDGKDIEISNINTESDSKIQFDNNIKVFDKNNSAINFEKLKEGNIIEIKSENGKVKSIAIAKNSWEMKHINDFKIDNDIKTIIVGSKSYNYSNETIIKYKGNDYDIKILSPLNVININGLDKNILFIDVLKSYGTLSFSSLDKIVGGILKIDNETPVLIKNLKTKDLSEGPHVITISGDNIETYTTDVFIKANEQINIDLDNIQFKCGILNLNINESGCEVYINNKKVSLSEPIMLNYGEYKLKIVKDGFKDFTQNILINTDTKTINAQLEKKINLGKINISTEPGSAKVYIDDAYIGLSPIEISIEYGKHNICVKKDSYIDANLPIDINNENSNYDIKLEEE